MAQLKKKDLEEMFWIPHDHKHSPFLLFTEAHTRFIGFPQEPEKKMEMV